MYSRFYELFGSSHGSLATLAGMVAAAARAEGHSISISLAEGHHIKSSLAAVVGMAASTARAQGHCRLSLLNSGSILDIHLEPDMLLYFPY